MKKLIIFSRAQTSTSVRKQGEEREKKNHLFIVQLLFASTQWYRLPAVSISRPRGVRGHEIVTDRALALGFAFFE